MDTRQLTWHADSKTLTGEASALGIQAGYDPGLFVSVTSHRTGRTVVFEYDERETDPEGEIVAWVYSPNSKCGVRFLKIYND